MRVQVKPTDSGFMMPSEEAKTSDWQRPGKKLAAPTDQNSNPNSGVKNQMSTTPNLLGGIGTYNRFETEAQSANRAAMYGESRTEVSQLTDKGRSR